ncbi:MAG: hypothetical protein ACFB21_01005 [Opitutales bacterium]
MESRCHDTRATPRPLSRERELTETDDPICCCEPEPRWQELADELGLEVEPGCAD